MFTKSILISLNLIMLSSFAMNTDKIQSILVRSDKKDLYFDVKDNTTIAEVKAMIAQEESIPADQQSIRGVLDGIKYPESWNVIRTEQTTGELEDKDTIAYIKRYNKIVRFQVEKRVQY
jgi:hypothetical protein